MAGTSPELIRYPGHGQHPAHAFCRQFRREGAGLGMLLYQRYPSRLIGKVREFEGYLANCNETIMNSYRVGGMTPVLLSRG